MTRVEDLADITLIDENTMLILTDDANKEIPSNMKMQCKWRHLLAKFRTNARFPTKFAS